jgi:hypothetical protein
VAGSDYLIHEHTLLPRRVYVGGPTFLKIVNFMRYAGREKLLPRAILIGDSWERKFLHDVLTPPPPAFSFVKIHQYGHYSSDLALVLWVHPGDLLTLAVVPRVSINGRDERGRFARAVLKQSALSMLTFDSKTGHYIYGTRRFTSNGFELLLAQYSHGLISVQAPEEVARVFEDAFTLRPPPSAPTTGLAPHTDSATLETSGRLVREWERQYLGKEVAVIEGHLKGYHGRVVGFNRESAIIEFGGRTEQPTVPILLPSLVLL